jgi:hypothetical protein
MRPIFAPEGTKDAVSEFTPSRIRIKQKSGGVPAGIPRDETETSSGIIIGIAPGAGDGEERGPHAAYLHGSPGVNTSAT